MKMFWSEGIWQMLGSITVFPLPQNVIISTTTLIEIDKEMLQSKWCTKNIFIIEKIMWGCQNP